jgi:hypothetical protein
MAMMHRLLNVILSPRYNPIARLVEAVEQNGRRSVQIERMRKTARQSAATCACEDTTHRASCKNAPKSNGGTRRTVTPPASGTLS